MPRLSELYLVTRTRNVEDAGTEDAPVLLVSRAGQDLFQTRLDGQMPETGKVQLSKIDVSDQALDSEGLELRLLAGGDDAWALEDAIAWGIAGRLPREQVVPLAALIELASPFTAGDGGTWLSTDADEGVASVVLLPVTAGTRTQRAWRMIVVFVTEPHADFLPGGGPGPSAGEFGDMGTAGPSRSRPAARGAWSSATRSPRHPRATWESAGRTST